MTTNFKLRLLSLVFIISLVAFSLSACAKNTEVIENQNVKNTPSQVGMEGTVNISVNNYSFLDAYKNADIVAEVKIYEWLKETDEPSQKTYFCAKLDKIYKNTTGIDTKDITIMQFGNSKFTVDVHPLFKNDDRLLLYLKKAEGIGTENTYWILGEYSTIFKIKNIDGIDYAIKTVGDYPELASIAIYDPKEKEKIKEYIKEDIIEYSALYKSTKDIQTFSLNTVENELKTLMKKEGKEQ